MCGEFDLYSKRISGAYLCYDGANVLEYFQFEYVCVEYGYNSGNTLHNCTVTDAMCSPYAFYDPDNQTCQPCPDGAYAGNGYDWHHSSECICPPGQINHSDLGMCAEACGQEYYFDTSTWSCSLCPPGSAGIREDDVHAYTSCDYCMRDYYYDWSGRTCLPCPQNGKRDSVFYLDYGPNISSCYLPAGTIISDESGTIEITEKCPY